MRLASIATLVAILSANVARAAEPSAADRAMAEALFRDAKELREANKIAEACPKFAESHRLDPKPGTILNLATCYELEGRTASAWAAYTEAATMAGRARQADREKFARSKMEELESRLSYLKVEVAPENGAVDGFTLEVDGKAMSIAAAGTRFPTDPGEHAVEARAPGRQTWSERITIGPGPVEKIVSVPTLAAEAPQEVAPPPQMKHSEPDGTIQRTIGWVAIGVGGASVLVGSIFGIQTIAEKGTIDEHCAGSFCDAEGLEANERAKDAATISTVAFVAAGIAAATGVVLILTAPRASGVAKLGIGPGTIRAVF